MQVLNSFQRLMVISSDVIVAHKKESISKLISILSLLLSVVLLIFLVVSDGFALL